MSLSIPRLLCLLSCLALWSPTALARTANAEIARIATGAATLERVHVRLDWPKTADRGQLRLRVGKLDAPNLGYAFRDLDWRCPLQRDSDGGWRCDGELRSGGGRPMRLAVDLGIAFTDVVLRQGDARLEVHRQAAAPDDTRIDLVKVPLIWSQALLKLAWADGRLKNGSLDGHLIVSAPANRPLQVAGPLTLRGAALETPDGSIAAEGLGAVLALDYRNAANEQRVDLRGELRGGELLFGSAYIALPPTPVTLRVDAVGDARGWRLPMLVWGDGDTLTGRGAAAFTPEGGLRALQVDLDSGDLSPLTTRYLSGLLGSFGLGDLALQGRLETRLQLDATGMRGFEARFGDVDIKEGSGMFRFDGLNGTLHYSASTPTDSALRWRSGQLYGLDFGVAELPLHSANGEIALRAATTVDAISGKLRFDHFHLRPPQGGKGLQANFGLTLDAFDIGKLAQSLGWPAFRGSLSGHIPDARYLDDRLVFEGGLEMRAFDGSIRVSSLAMERPFGVAPTLSADLRLDDLDLLAVTEVFDFGSISGRLDGSIRELRLVDWTATAFDAEFHTQRRRGVKQRISQRAVQNISSVGDASFVTSLQGKLIGLFDDFGYRRLGITCRLRNQVCAMGGLESVGRAAAGSGSDIGAFTIVQGAGIPRLNVVGYHRQVDWPTLVERLEAVGSGELKPVVE
jgi:hypothetical protein